MRAIASRRFDFVRFDIHALLQIHASCIRYDCVSPLERKKEHDASVAILAQASLSGQRGACEPIAEDFLKRLLAAIPPRAQF